MYMPYNCMKPVGKSLSMSATLASSERRTAQPREGSWRHLAGQVLSQRRIFTYRYVCIYIYIVVKDIYICIYTYM